MFLPQRDESRDLLYVQFYWFSFTFPHTHTLSNGHFTSPNVNFYSSKSIASVVADRTDAVEGTLKFFPSAAADVAEPATDGWCCVVPVAFRRPDAAKAAAAERRELLSRRML